MANVRRITVPLALDAEASMEAPGFGALPMRAIIGVGIAAIPAMALVLAGGSWGLIRWIIPALLLVVTLVVTLPMTDGIWIGTQALYRLAARWLPSGSRGGRLHVSGARWVGDLLEQVGSRALTTARLPVVGAALQLPTLQSVEDGLFRADPGGWRAVLRVRGPDAAIGSAEHAAWGSRLMSWIQATECPVQLVAVVDHQDADAIAQAFDSRLAGVRQSPLLQGERRLVEELAETSFGVVTYLVIDPSLADGAGRPYGSWILDAASRPSTQVEVVREKANVALRTARGFGIEVTVPAAAEVNALLARTHLGAESVVATERAVVVRGERTTFNLPHVVTRLPRSVGPGDLVDALLQSHSRALVNVTICPVAMRAARKRLDRMIRAREYAANQKAIDSSGDTLMAQEGQQLLELFAQGVRPMTMAISCAITGNAVAEAEAGAERFVAHAGAKGFQIVQARQPGLWPFAACAPGGAPLRRSLILTVEPVVERLLPALGTSFEDPAHALVGLNAFTGAPVFWSAWGDHGDATNHNLLMLGTSGGGKSVALKSLLYRHAIAGANFVVLDPDSEYRQLVAAVGGEYHELGESALNPFAVSLTLSADESAATILPVLAVLAGDTAFDLTGHPIRRMASEDKSWLHDQLRGFFDQLGRGSVAEPTLGDFVEYLKVRVERQARSEAEAVRARTMQERLNFYCKGQLATIFNRRSTFRLGARPVGIGFRQLANSYAADLTPALAVVLTAIYGIMQRAEQRLLVVVDEASYLTGNPDAGQVLETIARRGRKAGVGVWMASQKLEDFLTPLGKTLAAVSATKFILGCQESTLPAVRDAFGLTEEEGLALSPVAKGRGVLLADGGERAVVQVCVSDELLSLVSTSPALGRAA